MAIEYLFWIFCLIGVFCTLAFLGTLRQRIKADSLQLRHHYEVMTALYGLCSIVLLILILAISNWLP